MPSALPDGDPAPASGQLPPDAVAHLGTAPFGVYVHVPFCSVRCGYCDFNTYTLSELGDGTLPGTGTETFAAAALAELSLAATVLGEGAPVVDTVFVGGGTPTMLAAADLVEVLHGIRQRWGLADDAEVTTEANPDSVTRESLAELAAGGFTRVSLGMQSAVPHVLKVLDRTHDPANVSRAVGWAREVGLAVSLDLIYGTPGESLTDWRTSLEAAVALAPDHVSAYALVVEEGTKLAAQVRRGVVPAPVDDDEANKYELAEQLLGAAGYGWYEVSNWARTPADRCRHNVGYWAGGDWWGLGPGAHSHVGGVRWWNVKHPTAYAGRLASQTSPAAAREVLTPEQRLDERVLLGVRLVEGLPVGELEADGRAAVAGLIADGLVEGPAALTERRARLTLRGRLLADTVVRRLLGV
ncbi:MAG: radical SAM family heme chaperone HemW [Actinomycetota bacterium]|nr:radical SAM family heme chaperone HemW [Actinomycetota bacterium]